MDGEIGHDGEGGPVEEEEGALQGQQVHVRPEAATLKEVLRREIRRLKRKMKTNHRKFCKVLERCFHRCSNETMKPLFSPAGGFATFWKMNKRGNNKE